MNDAHQRYAFYPGCCGAQGEGRALSRSALACCRAIGVTAAELAGWTCCGGPEIMDSCAVGSAALAMRNVALAGRAGAHVLALCPGCVSVMRRGMRLVQQQPGLAEHTAGALAELGLALPADRQVRHVLGVIVDDVGDEPVRRRVARPLTGMRVACYYGCAAPDSPSIWQREPGQVGRMEALMEWLGADVVAWRQPDICCGRLKPAADDASVRAIVSEAAGSGADCISTACPVCLAALGTAASHGGPMPVFFTQLAAGAFGLPVADAGLRISRSGKRAVVRMRRRRADGTS